MPDYLLSSSTWKTVGQTPYEVAVLPWGATEAHNFHLPYGSDTIQAERVAALAAERAWSAGASVVVLPAVPFGVNTTQLDIKLTINVNPSTQAAVLADIVSSLESHGIEKLVILNSHGGNDLKPATDARGNGRFARCAKGGRGRRGSGRP
jgi:creatinine amidohydrolase